MAPIKQSKLKLKEFIIEFYKFHSKKALVTPIINGNAVTYVKDQCIGFWRSLIYTVIRMFENLMGRIHIAKENGNQGL